MLLVVKPIISATIEAVFDLLKYVHEGPVRKELKKWETTLRWISAILKDVDDMRSTNMFIQEWLSDLRDLAHDIEVILNELNMDAQRRKLLAESASTCRTVIECLSSLKPSRVKFNKEKLSKISDITARLEKLVDETSLKGVYGRRDEENMRLPSTSLVNAETVYGRSEDVDALLDLMKGEGSGGKISVIPIVGMAGIGKTTLAQLVFNDSRLEFDWKVWLHVGEDFDVIGMTKTILECLKEQPQANNLNTLQMKVKEKLSAKRFFIILDDVWNRKREAWSLLSAPFYVGDSGSKIILTTRDEDIASMMGTRAAYHLEGLSQGDCLSVFARHTLGVDNFDSHLHLKELGEEIVKRCQGSPLVAKAVGGVLRGQQNRAAWQKVLSSKVWDENAEIPPLLRLQNIIRKMEYAELYGVYSL